MQTVKTIQGDAWDTIAKRVYGDARRAQTLMEERRNIRLLDIEVFPSGVTVYAPEVTDNSDLEGLPAWRKG